MIDSLNNITDVSSAIKMMSETSGRSALNTDLESAVKRMCDSLSEKQSAINLDNTNKK